MNLVTLIYADAVLSVLQGFQRLSRVRRPKILRRSDRNNPSRINIVVSKVVMALDVIEIHGTGDSINLVKITKITVQVGVISDPADVAFKMTDGKPGRTEST